MEKNDNTIGPNKILILNDLQFQEIQKIAKLAHEVIGCDGLTRSDFILSKRNGGLYFLEINTIPGQTEASLCPKEAKAMGMSMAEFLEKQIALAIKRHKKGIKYT